MSVNFENELQHPAITFSRHDVLGLIFEIYGLRSTQQFTYSQSTNVNDLYQTDIFMHSLCTQFTNETRGITTKLETHTDFTLLNKQTPLTRHPLLATSDNLRSGRRDDAATPSWTGA
jgi:hypothetical protein